MNKSPVKVTIIDSYTVNVETHFETFNISSQEAYDLHQALGGALPELVQPFKPYPREPDDEMNAAICAALYP